MTVNAAFGYLHPTSYGGYWIDDDEGEDVGVDVYEGKRVAIVLAEELEGLNTSVSNLRFELEMLEATRLRDNAYLIERAEKAEKERDALKAQLSEQKRRTKYPFTAKGSGT